MEIGKDRFVILEYSVQLADGSYVKGEGSPASLNFIVGYGQVLSALEQRVLGLEEGTQTDFIIAAHDAFGDHDPNLVQEKPFSEFPQGKDFLVGKWIVATNTPTQAQYSYFVKAKTDVAVVLDYNHPLAGKDLHYHVKVAHVRPATQEELEYLRPCEQDKESTEFMERPS